MSNFSALKTAIQNAIKQNGNNEITGDILQEILLSIVSTLGDDAINDLEIALGTETTNRQNADGTLQQAINSEVSAREGADNTLAGAIQSETEARQGADSTLQGNIGNESIARVNADAALQQNINTEIVLREQADALLDQKITTEKNARIAADEALSGTIQAINNQIVNGYVYAGIARPSSAPTIGKVFYFATQAGRYTNFGNIDVVAGINILKKVGSTWVSEFVFNSDALVREINDFEEQVRTLLEDYKPIIINGDVTNAPDEEDITAQPDGLLKFKNKAYDPLVFSGMGCVYLRKNIRPETDSVDFDGFVEDVPAEDSLSGTPDTIWWDRINEIFVGKKDDVYYKAWTDDDDFVPVSINLIYMNDGIPYRWNGSEFFVDEDVVPTLKNILTQEMLSDANTIYVIQYDFTLGENITIPSNCVLEFDGGSLSNGNIVCQGTLIQAENIIIFNRITLSGTIKNSEIVVEWWGFNISNTGENNGNIMRSYIIPSAKNIKSNVYHSGVGIYEIEGTYGIGKHIEGETWDDESGYEQVYMHGIRIYGTGKGTIIKGIVSDSSHNPSDIFNMVNVHDLIVSDISVTAEKYIDSGAGTNAFSFIFRCENILVENTYVFDMPFVWNGNFPDGGKAYSIQSRDSDVTNVIFRNNYATGVSFGVDCTCENNVSGKYISGVVFEGNIIEKSIAGCYVGNIQSYNYIGVSSAINIINNRFLNCQYGALCIIAYGVEISNNIIQNNEEYTNQKYYDESVIGLYLTGCAKVSICNNQIDLPYSDYLLNIIGISKLAQYADYNPKNLIIINNIFRGNPNEYAIKVGYGDQPNSDQKYFAENILLLGNALYIDESKRYAPWMIYDDYLKQGNIIMDNNERFNKYIDYLARKPKNIDLWENIKKDFSYDSTKISIGQNGEIIFSEAAYFTITAYNMIKGYYKVVLNCENYGAGDVQLLARAQGESYDKTYKTKSFADIVDLEYFYGDGNTTIKILARVPATITEIQLIPINFFGTFMVDEYLYLRNIPINTYGSSFPLSQENFGRVFVDKVGNLRLRSENVIDIFGSSKPSDLGAPDKGISFFDTINSKPSWWDGSYWRGSDGALDMLPRKGTYAEIIAFSSYSKPVGFCYFATDKGNDGIGAPIYYAGNSKWVYSDGTIVL